MERFSTGERTRVELAELKDDGTLAAVAGGLFTLSSSTIQNSFNNNVNSFNVSLSLVSPRASPTSDATTVCELLNVPSLLRLVDHL